MITTAFSQAGTYPIIIIGCLLLIFILRWIVTKFFPGSQPK